MPILAFKDLAAEARAEWLAEGRRRRSPLRRLLRDYFGPESWGRALAGAAIALPLIWAALCLYALATCGRGYGWPSC